MERQERLINHSKRPPVLMRLQQRAEIRKRYIRQIPWWRRSVIGYLFAIPFVGLAMLFVFLEHYMLSQMYFVGIPLLLSVLFVALIWGVGPALFTVLLSTLALDYLYLPPFGTPNLNTWTDVLQILPFFAAGLIVAVITGQRESARLRALMAEQVAREHAEELMITNEELEQANKLKDHFLSIASHELKTPVTTIRGQAQFVLRRMSRQKALSSELEGARIALEKIDEQTHRLNTLIDDLLDISRIQAGKLELRLGECDLVEVCRKVIEDQHLLTGRTIELEVPPASIVLKADSDRLQQVVVNLVSNAIKYSPPGSPVRVRVSRREDAALIAVQDEGVGIPEEQQAYIFEPFYRAPSAEASSARGSGLGLAICRDIVERHGGRIWYEANMGQQGSTFCVELPLHS